MAITTTMLREFRADFKETVKSLEEKYGIAVTINNISYTKDSFHFKTECCEVKAGENKEEADFKKYCRLYDFTEEDYNKSFTTFNGKRYTLIGFNPKAPKFPYLIKDDNGKVFRGTKEQIKTATFKFNNH